MGEENGTSAYEEQVGRTATVIDFREILRRRGVAAPPDESDLRTRYQAVLVGFEYLNITPEDIEHHAAEFEHALHDLDKCLHCEAVEVKRLTADKATRYVKFAVDDCPLNPPGYWFGLSERACREGQKIVFSYHNCGGPVARAEELRRRWSYQGGDDYAE